MFRGELCLVFRLEASDYHHFCFIDDGEQTGSGYIPGLLHSVQPVALRSVPVFRLNRRWWNFLETEHLGPVLQAEICAVLVGGVTFFRGGGPFRKGEDMGCFELAGSTVLIFLNSDVLKRLSFSDEVMPVLRQEEVRVRMGEAIGILKN